MAEYLLDNDHGCTGIDEPCCKGVPSLMMQHALAARYRQATQAVLESRNCYRVRKKFGFCKAVGNSAIFCNALPRERRHA